MLQLLKQIFKVGIKTEKPPKADEQLRAITQQLEDEILKKFHRALVIRAVDAGSCNACELEMHALSNAYYSIETQGIHFVASPKHADMLLVTGPVAKHMEVALKRTYEAVPHPKMVVAVGDCAVCGGIFGKSYATVGQVSDIIPVDVNIPGCPPTPTQLIQGILTAIQTKK